jgi:hypothetical protein
MVQSINALFHLFLQHSPYNPTLSLNYLASTHRGIYFFDALPRRPGREYSISCSSVHSPSSSSTNSNSNSASSSLGSRMDVSDSSGVLSGEREREALVLEVELEFDLEGEVCISALIL